MATKRYVVPSSGPNTQAIQESLELVADVCKAPGGVCDAILFTPTKGALRAGHTVADALGEAVTGPLLKGQPLRLPDAGNLRHESERTLRTLSYSGVIWAIHPSTKMLRQIDSVHGLRAVVVVPWLQEELDEWIRTWQPEVVGGPTPPALTIGNRVVELALENLTSSVNLSTGLGHPLDRAKAVDLFRLLKRYGEQFDPAAVRAWAATRGWSPKGADDLRAVAQAILDGRTVQSRARGPVGAADLIDRLREQARSD